MKRLKLNFLLVSCLLFLALPALAAAQEYRIDKYDFRWEVGQAGKVALFVQKTEQGVGVLLSSPGGKVATVQLTPPQAKAVGDVLLKADEYHATFKEKTMESSQTVPAGDAFVSFFSKRKGADFYVLVHTEKLIRNSARFSKDEALEMGGLLQDVEARAAYADKRITP